jgi:hypothetical protein
MTVRDEGGVKEGFFLAAKGGHNAESHNHNDVGSFLVYDDAQPVLIDIGSGTYTKRTFSSERYTLWFNRSAYHNVPVINGYEQRAGQEFAAANVSSSNTKKKATFTAEIQEAYPDEAGIRTWRRQIVFDKQKDIEITEEFDFENASNEIIIPLMTTLVPVPKDDRTLLLYGNEPHYIIEFTHESDIKVEKMPLDLPEDGQIIKVWGDEIYRVTVIPEDIGKKGTLNYTIKRMEK